MTIERRGRRPSQRQTRGGRPFQLVNRYDEQSVAHGGSGRVSAYKMPVAGDGVPSQNRGASGLRSVVAGSIAAPLVTRVSEAAADPNPSGNGRWPRHEAQHRRLLERDVGQGSLLWLPQRTVLPDVS